MLVTLFAIFFLIALGSHLVIGNRVLFALLWSRLWSLPIVHSAEPVRFVVVYFLVLAMILALWLARPTHSRLGLTSQWLLGLLSVAFILGNLPTASDASVRPVRAGHALSRTHALPAFMTSGLYRRYLRPGETVVVVSGRQNAGMLFQAEANFYMRLAGGYINESLTDASGLPPAVEALRHDTPTTREQFRAYVRQAGVGAILVEQAWSARWMRVFADMGLPAVRAGGVVIYKTTGDIGSGRGLPLSRRSAAVPGADGRPGAGIRSAGTGF